MKKNSRMAPSLDARLSGVVMREAVKARVLAELKGEKPRMKKKLSAGLVLALALILLTAGIAVAATTGVFGLLSQKGSNDAPLLERLEQNAARIGDTQTLPAQDGFPETTFTVDQAFYDGDVFYLSYVISGTRQIEMGYVPDEEALAAFQVKDPQMSLPEGLTERLPTSGPWGAVVYQTYPSDGVYLESGEYLSPASSDGETLENGSWAGYFHFEQPLPDEIAGQPGFTIRYQMFRGKTYYYSDGETIWYQSNHREEVDLQPVFILREQSNAKHMLSEQFDDYAVTAAVSLSEADVRVAFTLENVPETWLREWDSLEQMKDVDFIYDYECWINGEKCEQVEGEEERPDGALRYIFTYSRPAELLELRLRPVYSNSGPRETEDLALNFADSATPLPTR